MDRARHISPGRRRPLGGLWPCFALLVAGACVPEIDTTRIAREDPSVGAAFYREMCQRVAVAEDPALVAGHPTCMDNLEPAATDGPRLKALFLQRDRLVSETNAALEAPVGGAVREMLEQMLPLYDDGTMLRATDTMQAWLASLEQDPEALGAIERIARRDGYVQPHLTPGFMRVLMSFDGTAELLARSLEAVTTTEAGTVTLANALSVLQPELVDAFDEEDDPNHSWYVLRELLESYDPELDNQTARYIVQRDARGLALTVGGVQASGTPFPLARVSRAEPRDQFGRLLDGGGDLVYRYNNVEGTVLAGLTREVARITRAAPGAIGQLLRPGALLLGPQRARSANYSSGQVRFGGYDTTRSPLLDLAYVAGVVAKRDTLLPALASLQELARRDERALAAGTQALSVALRMLREQPYADYRLEDDTAMTEELLDVVVEILREPGLAESLLDAFEDPRVGNLSSTIARYLKFKDLIDYNPQDLNGPPTGTMRTPVDRTRPDLRTNRSIFQRFIHLMFDARGARLCNKEGAYVTMLGISYPFFGSGYAECELTQIDDIAIFHSESIIGKAVVTIKDSTLAAVATHSLIEFESGIDGFGLYPTPASLDRFVFAPYNAYLSGLYDDVPTWDGVPLKSRHNGTIFAWELEGFYDNIAPIVQAFYDHRRIDLFVELFATLHRHYGSRDSDFVQSDDPNAALYAPNTGIVRFEPVIAEAVATNPLAGIGRALAALKGINVGGIDGRARVLALMRSLILPEQNAGLTTRAGRSYTVRNDGQTVVNITPVHLLVDALRSADAALALDPELSTAMGDGIKGLVGGLLDSNGQRMASSDTAPLAAQLLGFVQARLQAHVTAGDLNTWADGMDDRLQEVIDQPLVQTLVPLCSLLMRDPEARAQVDALLQHLVENDFYTSTVQGLADALQLLDNEADLRPLARSLATAADPKNGMFQRGITLMQAMGARDTGRALPQLLARLVSHPEDNPNAETPVEALLDIMLEVNRNRPGSGTPRSRTDYAKSVSVVRSFLSDPDRGLERLYEIIANR